MSSRVKLWFVVALLGTVLVGASGCGGQVESIETTGTARSPLLVPAGFVDELVVSGLASPTAMALAPDGRLFVTQQGGQLQVIKNGALLTAPFVTVSTTNAGERGLLGIAFDPAFASNQFIYVYYTVTTPTVHNRMSRFTANGDVAVAGSERILLELNDLSSATNHNGGAMHFGPDGKLYIGVGENANGSNAQTLTNLLGKILRLNSDGTVPSDNPFFTQASGINRAIWAMGLRNPFTFTFQPGTGRMFLNDVGQDTWEEIDDGIAGSNYGWPTTEGATTDPRFRGPLFAYQHGTGPTTGCAITGGAFYNPATVQFPSSFVGRYFFADFCSSWIRVFNPIDHTAAAFGTSASSPVDLMVTADGSLHYLQRGSGSATGEVHRVRFAESQPPTITAQPADALVAAGQQATFTVAASGSQPQTFQWQRATTNIPGATGPALTVTVASADNGAMFRVVVTNAFGSVTSRMATLTVTVAADSPTATITTPASGATYRAGTTVSFGGTGTDPQDGNLPPSAFTWEVVFHHDTHTHPFLAPTSGIASGSFAIPDRGETATNVWYRIHLSVIDSSGLSHATFRDLLPQVSNLMLSTQPAGLAVTLDGSPVTTPVSVSSVVGMIRALGVVSPQSSGGTQFTFASWSDGGLPTHEIATPASAATFTATFVGAVNSLVFCANENGVCSFSGTREVQYGASGKFFYRTATNSIGCSNTVFGDPIRGVRKQCNHRAVPATGWTTCASENGVCSFAGTREVRYGANGAFAYGTFASSVGCNNGVFGDPRPGTLKACSFR
jgi:glucose/arabinose dehydrogenase